MNERDDEFVVRLHRELDALLKKEKRLRRTRKIQNRTMDVHIKKLDTLDTLDTAFLNPPRELTFLDRL